MNEGATDIFKNRKDEGYYSTLIERYFMDSEMKFREFFRVLRDSFHLILTNKGRHNNSKLQLKADTDFS